VFISLSCLSLEIKKMFGHNNEVVTMKLSNNGKWLASSSKARFTQSCHVIIWSTKTKELLTKLEGHESTVVCLDFSFDDQYLASSGKDRSLCIYKATSEGENSNNPFVPIICLKSAHKRIVWDVW
jgi:WD40 repeat protein